MGTTKKPRKKYQRRGVIPNPMAYVLEGMTPIRDHEYPLVELKIKNHLAMTTLLQGGAKKADMDKLISMSNVVEALWHAGFGKEYRNICVDGRYALISIANRAVTHGKFTPTGPEIGMLNALMDLHDAQMDVITVGDMELALAYIDRVLRQGHDTIKLLPVPDHLR